MVMDISDWIKSKYKKTLTKFDILVLKKKEFKPKSVNSIKVLDYDKLNITKTPIAVCRIIEQLVIRNVPLDLDLHHETSMIRYIQSPVHFPRLQEIIVERVGRESMMDVNRIECMEIITYDEEGKPIQRDGQFRDALNPGDMVVTANLDTGIFGGHKVSHKRYMNEDGLYFSIQIGTFIQVECLGVYFGKIGKILHSNRVKKYKDLRAQVDLGHGKEVMLMYSQFKIISFMTYKDVLEKMSTELKFENIIVIDPVTPFDKDGHRRPECSKNELLYLTSFCKGKVYILGATTQRRRDLFDGNEIVFRYDIDGHSSSTSEGEIDIIPTESGSRKRSLSGSTDGESSDDEKEFGNGDTTSMNPGIQDTSLLEEETY